MLRRLLATDPDTRWCPRPNCTYAVIATGCASCPKIECERPGCGMYIHFSVKSISRKINCSYGQKLGIIQNGFFNSLNTLILLNVPGYSFCYHCKAEWHPNQTCDAARAQRHHKTFRSSSVPFRFVNKNKFLI